MSATTDTIARIPTHNGIKGHLYETQTRQDSVPVDAIFFILDVLILVGNDSFSDQAIIFTIHTFSNHVDTLGTSISIFSTIKIAMIALKWINDSIKEQL